MALRQDTRRREGVIFLDITNNIKLIEKEDREYPGLLRQISGAPDRLYCIGDISLLHTRSVAVVGTRKCSEYGRQAALKAGRLLAENRVTAVSGMAAGIDRFVHEGALENGGGTIAVLACGPDICYPRSNKVIYDRIVKNGLIISEYPPGTRPRPWQFPMRNRIISGLCLLTAVIEAGTGSGSLITAREAAEQGRDVMALPGNINSPFSLGTNKLIADGAGIITVLEDILRTAGIDPVMDRADKTALGGDELRLYKLLAKNGEMTVDEVCAAMQKDSFEVNGLISVMEIKGIVSFCLGKIFIAKY